LSQIARTTPPKSNRPFFLGHLRVEDDLQQQIAELVLQRRVILVFDRRGDFVGFPRSCTGALF
jgi:hypothetical protein